MPTREEGGKEGVKVCLEEEKDEAKLEAKFEGDQKSAVVRIKEEKELA